MHKLRYKVILWTLKNHTVITTGVHAYILYITSSFIHTYAWMH